jgi:Sigma-70 region 2
VAKSEEAIKARRLDDWIKRVAQGDQTALGTLYDSTSPLVHGLVRRIVGDSGLAEDVTLDVYMQVWQQAKRYDPERGSAMAWLMTLARRRSCSTSPVTGASDACGRPFGGSPVQPDRSKFAEHPADGGLTLGRDAPRYLGQVVVLPMWNGGERLA